MSNIALYIQPFFIALFVSAIMTFAIVKISERYSLIPKDNAGKVPERPFFRFGGASMIVSFLYIVLNDRNLVLDPLKAGMIASSVIILAFGIYDDIAKLSWRRQFLMQVSVVATMILAGLSVDYIANPFGGREFRLDQIQLSIINYEISVFGSLFVLFWIIGSMNVMNWLDGLDGLAGGVGFIGAITLFLISISDIVNQPPLGIMLAALAGSIGGFLIFNMYPARIIMGTSGSYFLGFMLSVLAIFSGGKIATALLIMGFPIIDAMWVMAGRIRAKNSPFKGDATHLHYRLLERGWSQRKIVCFVCAICFIFAVAAILFQNAGKVMSLFLLLIIVNYIMYQYVIKDKKGKIIDTKRE